MENLLDYLLYALFGHNVTNVSPHKCSGVCAKFGKSWTITFEGEVYITLDEHDLGVIHELYNMRESSLDQEERARYMRIFDLCK